MASDKYTDTFTIDVVGDFSERNFKGTFKVKTRLSMRDDLKRAQTRRALLGGMIEGVDDRALEIANILSELSVRIIDAPEFWKDCKEGLDLDDDNVLGAVYEATMAPAIKISKDLADKATVAKQELTDAK